MIRSSLVVAAVAVLAGGPLQGRAEKSWDEVRAAADAQVAAAKVSPVLVEYETSKTSYMPAGEIVGSLPDGRKKLRLKSVPGGLVEGWQDGPNSSAALAMNTKVRLFYDGTNTELRTHYGDQWGTTETLTASDLVWMPGVASGPEGPRGNSRSQLSPVVLPVALLGIAAEDTGSIAPSDDAGVIRIVENASEKDLRERLFDALTGRLRSVRYKTVDGVVLQEREFFGTAPNARNLALPTMVRFSWKDPDGFPRFVLELRDIKYQFQP
jgi:hypothetical protein